MRRSTIAAVEFVSQSMDYTTAWLPIELSSDYSQWLVSDIGFGVSFQLIYTPVFPHDFGDTFSVTGSW